MSISDEVVSIKKHRRIEDKPRKEDRFGGGGEIQNSIEINNNDRDLVLLDNLEVCD